MIAILKRPYADFEGQESKWVGANNPIIYEFEVDGIDVQGYWVKIDVYDFNTDKVLGVIKSVPFIISGYAKFKVDVSGVVKSYLDSYYEFTTEELNQAQSKSSVRCYIKYFEYTYDSEMSTNDDSPNQFYAINGGNQFGNKYGSNFAEYVPLPASVVKAKFLTNFKNPVKFAGYPLTIGFVYSANIGGIDVKKIEKELNVNKVEVYNSQGNLDTSQGRSVNMLKITETFASEVKYVRMWLEAGVATNDLYVDDDYVDDDYVQGGGNG